MAIRELLQNAVENAMLLDKPEERQIRLLGTPWRSAPDEEPVPKLTIWNRGQGMSAEKLLAVLDLAPQNS